MKKSTKMMPHCLTPDISVALHATAPPGLATSIHVRLIRIVLSKTTKTRDLSFHFISFFYFISFHFISLRFIHFIHSFILFHSFIHPSISFIHSIIHFMGVPCHVPLTLGCGAPPRLSRKGTLARRMSSFFFALVQV